MCLAIPARICAIDNKANMASVDILGVSRDVSIRLVPLVNEGDFVLVHAGFAIEVIDEASAQETIDLIMEFPELAGDNLPQESAPAEGGF